jgi:predicted acylesterase/phospholipase RssA
VNGTLLISLIAAAIGIGAIVAALMAVHSTSLWRARVASLESNVAALRRELEMVASISARAGRQVQRVEQEYSGVAERIDLVESRGAAMPGAVDEAIDWARRGVDAEKLAKQFGLSIAEAELVVRLHGIKRSA